MNNILAPIVLFVYNRPKHTRQTLEALSNNKLAKDTVLYIYADGAKEGADEKELHIIQETRAILEEKQWCKEVHIIKSEKNKGLADSIVKGVTEVVNKYGRVIVLEDDIVTSPEFLQYMNDALDLYENDNKVMHVGGYIPLTTGQKKLPETFFLRFMSCWGWGTWKESWNYLITDIDYLHNKIYSLSDLDELKFEGVLDPQILEQLEDNYNGKIKTWAFKWFLSIFIRKGLCLYPKKSLVNNIGLDGSGENCGVTNIFEVDLASNIKVKRTLIEESKYALKYLKKYYKYGNNLTWKGRLLIDYPQLHRMLYMLYKLFKR